MEALIIAIAALAVIVLIEAGYWIAISLTRWAPVIAAGALVGCLAQRHGVDTLEAIALGLIACVIARYFMREAHTYDDGPAA